ncbi:MAG TPA: vWA domain-containing protein [Myxococcota bacterium]|nr:vWA domain-containing protein [Myxococcota bacterium]
MHPDSSPSRLRTAAISALAALLLLAPAGAHEWNEPDEQQRAAPPARHEPAHIEVAFVLDTTGSMTGLIEGAKRKIWSIANQLVSAQQETDVRFALIGYRDRGDTYVTTTYDLTSDIDAIYARLMQFQADGGGDGPESVNQALHEAVTRLDWSTAQDVYRVIFLVGDAPPHLDYQDDIRYDRSVRLARQRDITINAIQCGAWDETAQIWREIASLGMGTFAAIAQDGGMVAVATPMDDELAKLNRELAGTVVAFGREDEQREAEAKVGNALRASAPAAADRLAYLAKAGEGSVVTGTKDLVDEAAAGRPVASVAPEALPEPLRAMPADARQEFVDEQLAKRKQVQERIARVSQERDAYLAKEEARQRAAGNDDAFDQKVNDAIKAQAAKKGIRYE